MEISERKTVRVRGKALKSIQAIIKKFENKTYDREQYQIAARDLRSFLTQDFENIDELKNALVLLKKQVAIFLERIGRKYGWFPPSCTEN